MSPRASLVIVLALAALSACTSGIGLAAPRGMNHPVDVAFACFDVSITGMPITRPLADCAMVVDVSVNSRQPPVNAGLHMHALVTQSTRGEVGAVDLIARTELDSDMSVPGYTFVPVGQLPTQIVVPPTDASCTYVASRGPVDGRRPGISIIDTRRFRSGAGLDHNPFPIHAPFPLPGAPSDMVLAPDQGSLWVTMDALGVLVRIPILGSCRLGAIDLVVPLYEEVPAGVTFMQGSSVDLARTCGLAPGTTPAAPFVAPPRTPDVDLNTEPEPIAIAMDLDNGVILVADRALPLIHRVNIVDGTLLPPLATGVPVRDVVVTPRVPDSYDLTPDGLAPVDASEITFSRYVYAIDDTDGTVLAMEYTDPTATNFGEVIPVDVQGARRPDRLAMPIVARTLEIITPQYDTTVDDPRLAPLDPMMSGTPNPFGYGLCFPSAPAPSQPPSPLVLRGVFLVVAGDDGAIRVIDIYDLDAPCRGRAIGAPITPGSDCINPTQIGDIAVYVRRHRPRVQQLLATFVTILTGPSVNYPGGGSQVLDVDGLPVGHDVTMPVTTTSLEPLVDPDDQGNYDLAAAACPAGLGMVWGAAAFTNPDTSSGDLPIVCSLVDPFAAVAENWTATYEGTIPGTYTSSANAQTIDAAHTTFNGHIDTRLDYCALGVIGSDEATAPADWPEALYGGDMMSIITAMPETNLEADPGRCFPVVGITQVGQTQLPILVQIQHAFSTPTGQQEPYTGQLFMEPGTPLEQRPGAVGDPCPESGDCSTAEYPNDTCDETSHCVHFPTIADAIRCYGDTLITIDVRSHGAFTVSGSRTGFQARVIRRDTDGTCVYDTASTDGLRQGHAFNDVVFHNHRIAFRPRGGTTVAEIRMQLTGGPSQLGIDLSQSANGTRGMALPAGLRYSPEMWALYAIEAERGGLVELTMRPLARTSTAYQ